MGEKDNPQKEINLFYCPTKFNYYLHFLGSTGWKFFGGIWEFIQVNDGTLLLNAIGVLAIWATSQPHVPALSRGSYNQ